MGPKALQLLAGALSEGGDGSAEAGARGAAERRSSASAACSRRHRRRVGRAARLGRRPREPYTQQASLARSRRRIVAARPCALGCERRCASRAPRWAATCRSRDARPLGPAAAPPQGGCLLPPQVPYLSVRAGHRRRVRRVGAFACIVGALLSVVAATGAAQEKPDSAATACHARPPTRLRPPPTTMSHRRARPARASPPFSTSPRRGASTRRRPT